MLLPHYRAFVGAGYELCCDIIEGDHLSRSHKQITVKRQRRRYFNANGTRKPKKGFCALRCFFCVCPQFLCSSHHENQSRSMTSQDVQAKLGPILHIARYWPKEPPKFETLKNYKKSRKNAKVKKFSHR